MLKFLKCALKVTIANIGIRASLKTNFGVIVSFNLNVSLCYVTIVVMFYLQTATMGHSIPVLVSLFSYTVAVCVNRPYVACMVLLVAVVTITETTQK